MERPPALHSALSSFTVCALKSAASAFAAAAAAAFFAAAFDFRSVVVAFAADFAADFSASSAVNSLPPNSWSYQPLPVTSAVTYGSLDLTVGPTSFSSSSVSGAGGTVIVPFDYVLVLWNTGEEEEERGGGDENARAWNEKGAEKAIEKRDAERRSDSP